MSDTVQVPREAILAAAEFLIERLDEFANEVNLDEQGLRIWVGWVEPAISRLRNAPAAAPQASDPRDAEIERLTRERDESIRGHDLCKTVCDQLRDLMVPSAASLSAALAEISAKAREYASHYPEASDGRNTFILFAEWVDLRAALSPTAPEKA